MTDDSFAEYKEQPGACAECGNSPVNHLFVCMLNTTSVALGALFFRAQKYRAVRRLEDWVQRVTDAADAWHARLMYALGAVRFGDDVSKARTYRSRVIWEEAARRGIAMQQVFLLKIPTDVYRAKLFGRWIYFKSIPIPPGIPQDAYLWIDDKCIVKRVLGKSGVPVPFAASVLTLSGARAALRRIGAPIVVKPRAGSRGRHTATNVRTLADLDRAFRSARRLCRFVSIERCLEGSVCRATLVRGRLVGFFQAEAPRVVGDGSSSVRELVEKQNAGKHERIENISLNAEHEQFLRRQKLAPDSVPDAGRVVVLTHRTGRLFGGETRELLETVHPALRAHLERAAHAIGNAPVVGFDLIIKDPETNPDMQEWGIIEANSLPFIDLHYLPLRGKPSNPAAAVWDMWHI